MLRRALSRAAVLLLSALSVSCTSTVTVQYTPRATVGGPKRRIAVVQKAGEESRGLADNVRELESGLVESLTRGQRFIVLERREIATVLQETAFSLTAIVDERSACEAGKLLAADAIVLLELTGVSLVNQRHEIHHYLDGHASASAKMIHVETGQILVAAREEAYVSVIERYSTIAEARDLLLHKLAKQVATVLQPQAAKHTVLLERTANPRLRDGVRFAQEGLWEEAAEVWESLVEESPDDAVAHYDLAIANRVLGDAVGEREHLKRAIALRPSKRLYLRALARLKRSTPPE